MHKILNRTHRRTNINILKARDYYFDKARNLNNRWRRGCLWAPIVVSVVGMISLTLADRIFTGFVKTDDTQDVLETIVGVIAIVAFVLDMWLQNRIDKHLSKSNELREMYDCRVIGIEPNRFFSNSDDTEIKEWISNSKYVSDSDKYEVWYREMFCEDDFANAICVMMDNCIYTYRVYEAYKKILSKKIIGTAVLFVLYTGLFCVTHNAFGLITPFAMFIAVFDAVKDLVSSHSTAKQLADENKKLYEYILNNADELKRENEGKKSALIRNLEDVVITNREKSLFIPKSVRKKFLDNGSIYYLQLDNIKCRYMGDNVSKPETAEEFEIPVAVDISDDKLTDVEEKNVVNMQQIHDELFGMLKDVKKVFDEGGVQFMLDGGTLIGSIRDNGKFLPWDDDVDISIRTEDVERAKKLVREKLGEKYVVQDCETEKYYSPRLSSFRIRQKNEVSFTDEKDSVLYERYDGRGLFLDVYAYCPVLVGRNVDWCYRKLFIHPLHRHIKRIEDKSRYKAKGNERFSEHYLAKFEKLKKKYVSRIEWYLKHVNCRDYYCYEPRYLDNLKHPGPYIPTADLYGTSGKEKQSGKLEGESFDVPAIPENVLRAFYGENWNRSPYCSVEELKQKGEPKTYNILITKHIDYMYKRWLVYPNVKKLEKLQARRRDKNRYDIYDKKIARLEKKIKSRNDWYLAHAHCRKYVAYQPAMLNKNRLKIYIKRAEFEKTDGSKYNFDIHMYTKSAFDATLYKHLKRASIGGKEYVADK